MFPPSYQVSAGSGDEEAEAHPMILCAVGGGSNLLTYYFVQ